MTDPAYPMPAAAEERRQQLAAAVAREVSLGGRVEAHTDEYAVVVRGAKVNHVLHLLISVLTCGVWALVWLYLAATQRETRAFVSFDPYGHIAVRYSR